jgi:2-polyprenyl-3-methyl-5-hydroxy-6-metoxy-1,4-benzoquinol methylase
LTARVAGAIDVSCLPGHPTEILETGAGDGSVTEHQLARGYAITATEMSAESIESMNRRFGSKDRFSAVHDPGHLRALPGTGFDAVLFASVLHHIPDLPPKWMTRKSGILRRQGGSNPPEVPTRSAPSGAPASWSRNQTYWPRARPGPNR